ncbi:MAG: DUF4290 domain-containing protein [Bacteroidota bacterium]
MEWDIAYNTTRDELIISEYGRSVQDLLRNANGVEDDKDRQAYVERVIKLMLQMQPGIKTQDNYQERLWRHAFLIAGEPLNVQIPEGISIEAEAEAAKAPRLPYPNQEKRRMRHYGQHVQQLIKAATELEDGPERDHATYIAAYYMKIALSSWDQGKFVNEEMIRKDLYEMSDRKLVLGPDVKLGEPGPNQPEQHPIGRKKKKKKKNKTSSNRPKQQRSNKSRNRKNRRR